MSAGARVLGHWISFGLTLALMCVVLGFMVYTRRNRLRYKSFWKRNGPLILVCIAIPLIMADIIRHVLQDEGVWLSCIPKPEGGCYWYSSAEYKSGEAETTSDENLTHLSTIGILFAIVATYSGFILLAFGTLWNANIMAKIKLLKEQWRTLRAQARGFRNNKTVDDIEAGNSSLNAPLTQG